MSLLKRQDYVLALRDAGFAFENSYPAEMQYKLLERVGRCHLALGHPDEAKANFEKAVDNLERFAAKGERKKSKLQLLQTLIGDCDKKMKTGSDSDSEFPTAPEKYIRNLVPKLPNPHPQFPAFSDAVEVRYGGPDVGRFCVAQRRIGPGDLIAVGTPYVWLLGKVRGFVFLS